MEPTTLIVFQTLYETYYPHLYQRAYRLLRHHEQAQDVTQETFVKAFRACEQMSIPENPFPWLYRIVTNTAYDVLRRGRRSHASQSLESENAPPLPERTCSDPQESYPEQALMRAALAHLSSREQWLLLRHVVEGYSIAELAGQLGVSPCSVKTRLYRARRALRDAYAKEMGDECNSAA